MGKLDGKVAVITAPSLAGTAHPGSMLTIVSAVWNVAGVSTGIQWTRNGMDVPGATSTTLKIG